MHTGTSAGPLELSQSAELLVVSGLELPPLPEGFEVLHEVHGPGRPRASADHVLVGPPGVFVVDVMDWSGAVEVRAGTLLHKGYSRAKQTESVHRAALFVGLSLGASWASAVVPVICLSGSSALELSQAGPVTVLSLDRLTAWWMTLPCQLTPAQVRQIVTSLRIALPGANAVAVPAVPSAPNRHLKSRRRMPEQIERRAVPRREP